MANTRVIISAVAESINDSNRYRLSGGCTEKGDIQDVFIFLLEIINAENASLDEFVRVCSVADMVAGGFYTNRAQAETAGHAYYRSNEMVKYFDDVQIANAAKTVLEDSINTLTKNYTTYSTDFETTNDEIDFPTAEPTATEALKNTYESSLESYNEALEEQATAGVALTEAQSAYDAAESQIDKRDSLKTKLTENASNVSVARQNFNSYVTPGGTSNTAAWIVAQIDQFISGYNAYGSGADVYKNNLQSSRNSFGTNRDNVYGGVVNGSFQDAINDLNALTSTLNSYFDITDSTLSTAESELAAAKAAKVEADAAVTALYSIMLLAYQAAKAVCPGWNTEAPPPPLSSS